MSKLSTSALARSLVGLLLPSPCLICATPPHPCCPACRPAANAYGFQRAELSGFAGASYSPELAKLLGAYKDSGQLWLKADLRPLTLAAFEQAAPLSFDFVTYIGSSVSNYRARGYNPALELLRDANRVLKLPLRKTLVTRGRVLDQSKLTQQERAQNLAGALVAVANRSERSQRALLFDDVVTTGSTVLAAREVLVSANIEVVAVVALAEVERRFGSSDSGVA